MGFDNHIETTIPKGIILACFDLTNAYTEIPYYLPLEEVEY